MCVKMWICLYKSDIFILVMLALVMIEADNKFARERIIDTSSTNVDQCAGFDCGTPLRQRFSLLDIVDTKSEGDVDFKEITLFRCRPSFGCCRVLNQTCLANKTTDHCIKFDFTYHNADRATRKYIKIKNHVSCSCQETEPTQEDLEEPMYSMMEKCDV